MANKKDNSMFGMILAGIAALVAGVVGFNELSKSKSGVKGSTMGGYNSVRPPNTSGTAFPHPKKSDCGCGV